jgi:eukaryotic-like serine/threonine-protein kinase
MHESRYQLVRPLAVGGMAELFLGVVRGAEGFEKRVAIKRVLPHMARDPAIARMFLLEARLATHLQHQNIASVYDVGTSDEGLFLVMELVNGWDLGMLLRHANQRGLRFPPHLVAFIGTQVLAGLVHAYRRQYQGRPVLTAHRDVSPSNILISREGEVKVADFGIARVEGVSSGTQPGTFKGKLAYASPETLHGEPATALSDQFSLGLLLHELLTGQHPFSRPSGDPMAIAFAIAQHSPPPLDDVPVALRAVVMRALAKEDHQRFSRPEEMAEALARYLSLSGQPANSQSLAAFITHLEPPPTLLEREEPAPQAHERTRTSDRPSLKLRSVSIPFELEHPAEDWEGTPTLELSERGDEPRDEPAAAEPARHDTYEKTYQWEATPDLELAERAPQAGSLLPPPAKGPSAVSRALRLGVPLVLVAGALGWAVLHADTLRQRLGRNANESVSRPSLSISISSEPQGATVTIEGEKLGTTPMALENVYPAAQDVPIQLTLKGYKPWKGVFRGGEPVVLDVQLKR